METNVGTLRQQSALSAADRPVIIITDDAKLEKLLGGKRLKVVEFYPDTTDFDGAWRATFKVKVTLE